MHVNQVHFLYIRGPYPDRFKQEMELGVSIFHMNGLHTFHLIPRMKGAAPNMSYSLLIAKKSFRLFGTSETLPWAPNINGLI